MEEGTSNWVYGAFACKWAGGFLAVGRNRVRVSKRNASLKGLGAEGKKPKKRKPVPCSIRPALRNLHLETGEKQ